MRQFSEFWPQKRSLGLHKKKAEGTLVPEKEALEIVGCEKHKSWAKKVADQAITLVRDEQELLPISLRNTSGFI